MTFREFLAVFSTGPDGASDFVRDARNDPQMPDAKSWDELEAYMGRYSQAAQEAARKVWLIYEASARNGS
jgi:hypothetical protein